MSNPIPEKGNTLDQPIPQRPRASASASHTMAAINAEIGKLDASVKALSGNLLQLAFKVEQGDPEAKKSAKYIRRQIGEANERIEELRTAQAGGATVLAAARKTDARQRKLETWSRVLDTLKQRDRIKDELSTKLGEAATLAAKAYQLGNLAHRAAIPTLTTDQAHACAPGAEEFALSLFGTFMRVSGLPTSWILDLNPIGLDGLTNAEPPSDVIDRQCDRLLAHLPADLKLVRKGAA